MNGLRVGIAGSTGAVGIEMLRLLEETAFPVSELSLFASERSTGMTQLYKGQPITIKPLSENSFRGLDLLLNATSAELAERFLPIAGEEGVRVIDNSSAFRMRPEVPLIVPEVNPDRIDSTSRLIANPNCSTIQMCVALAPFDQAFGIRRIIVSTYQAASGAGKEAMEELIGQTKAYANGSPLKAEKFPYPLLFNLIPHIDRFEENGYTREEMKMVNETRKIFEKPEWKISATAVRVPVIRAHSEAITLELEKDYDPNTIKALLGYAPGIVVRDDPEHNGYPMPADVAHRKEVFVGRIRKDLAFDNGVSFWVVADQLLKGAAWNAIQIAQILNERVWGIRA